MMKKMWKNRSGVSPVIATILMVAITVVLAAVLYVMVMGFGGNPASTPTGQFKAAERSSDGESYRIQVLSISEAKSVSEMRFTVDISGTSTVYTIGETGTLTSLAGVASTTMSFTDLNGDKKVSTGDYFTITEPTAEKTYTVALSFAPSSGTGGVVCDTSFTVPKAA